MSYGVQPPAKKPSSLPRILTIICSVLAVIFLLVSATMYVSARSKAQEIEDMRAEIQSADAKTVEIDSEITSTKEQIAAAKAKKDAEEWCTDFDKDSMKVTDLDKMATTLKTMSEPQRNAVGEVCGGKKAFAEAFAKDLKRGMVNTSTPTCNGDGTTVTISGTVSLDAPTLAQIGSIDVVYEVFAANHEISDSDSPLGTTTAAVPPGGTGNFSTTVPFATTGDFYCAVRVKSIWPTGL